MKNIALLTLMSMLVIVSAGQNPQWTQQSSPIADDFVSLSIVDDMHVWIAGSSGNILYTEDGGEHWIVQNVFPKFHFESICFSDSQHGCIVGWGGELVDSTVILVTSDGGQNWQEMQHPKGTRLFDVFFINNTRGWAVGLGVQTGWIIFTDDGGVTWDRQMQVMGVSGDLYSVHFRDEEHGNICGIGGTFLITASAGIIGNGWAVNISIPSLGKDLYDVWNFGDSFGWSVGQDGTIIYTDDSWNNWLDVASGTEHDLNAVGGDGDAGKFWAVGDAGTIVHRGVWILPWAPQNSGVDENLNDVGFVNADLGWAVGDNGTILQFTTGGFGVEEFNENTLTLYPNPCSGAVRLRYLIHDSGYLISDLYMISGGLIRELDRQEVGPGAYEMEIDVSDLPAGVYLLRLQVGGEVAVRKLVVGD